MLQAALAECLLLYTSPFRENGFVVTEVDVSWSDVVRAFVATLVVAIANKMARTAWALLAKGESYRITPAI